MYEKAMAKVEARTAFRAWATELEGSNSRFAIVQEEPGHGLRWARFYFDEFNAHEVRRSQGCFYDDVPEHPEGALQWAIDAARAMQRQIKDALAGM